MKTRIRTSPTPVIMIPGPEGRTGFRAPTLPVIQASMTAYIRSSMMTMLTHKRAMRTLGCTTQVRMASVPRVRMTAPTADTSRNIASKMNPRRRTPATNWPTPGITAE